MTRLPPAVRQVLHVGGHRVVVRTQGHGTHSYVLIPGLGVAHRYFAPLATELASGAVVHTVHLADYGRTAQPFGIDDLAETAWCALDRLGVERPVLVGHSMGTQVVVEMARRRSGSVPGAVLLAPVANAAERSGWLQAVRLWTGSAAETPESNWIVISDSLRCGVPAMVRRLRVLLAYPTEDRVATVNVPLVIMRGERDLVVPRRWAEELSRRAPDGTLVEVLGEGHIIMFRSPQAVAAQCRAVAKRG